ncbi:MAG: RNA polymerase sigma factor [Polyangiaceae bacterium]
MAQTDWTSSAFRSALCAMVRRRVPEADVEDVVQSTLVEALASKTRPEDPEATRKWIWGIARNKVADYHRSAKKQTSELTDQVPDSKAGREHAVDDMLRWAMSELPKEKDSEQTLEWLLREGEGDKLEAIAESSNLPAPRVRQRVSRLRKHFRERWAADLAALAALGIVTVLLVMWWKKSHEEPVARPDESALPHEATPLERAADERKKALAQCDALQWRDCLDGLDRAKALDPAGDAAENVQNARKLAEDALNPAPTDTAPPIPSSSATPSDSSKVKPMTTSMGPTPMPTATTPPFSNFSDSSGFSGSSGGGTSGTPSHAKHAPKTAGTSKPATDMSSK